MDILDKVQQMLADGTYPKPEPTPYSDQAFGVLKADLSFEEKLNQIRELQKMANAAGGEDANRFGWVYESIYADATEEQIKLMHQDAE